MTSALNPAQKFGSSEFTNTIRLTERMQAVRMSLGAEGLSATKLREGAALALLSGDRHAAKSGMVSFRNRTSILRQKVKPYVSTGCGLISAVFHRA
jgi:hypothetical protein